MNESEKMPQTDEIKNNKDKFEEIRRRMFERASVDAGKNQAPADGEQEPENQSSAEPEIVSPTLEEPKTKPIEPEIQPQPKSELPKPENQPAGRDVLPPMPEIYEAQSAESETSPVALETQSTETEEQKAKREEQEKKDAENKAKLSELTLAMDKARENLVKKEQTMANFWQDKVVKILGRNAGDMPRKDLDYYQEEYNKAEEALVNFQTELERQKEPNPIEEAQEIARQKAVGVAPEKPEEKPSTGKMDETLESEKISLAAAHEDAGLGYIREDYPEPKPKRKKPKITGIPLLRPLEWAAKRPKAAAKDLFTQKSNREYAAKVSQKTITPDMANNFVKMTNDPQRRAQWEREAQAGRAFERTKKKLEDLEDEIKKAENMTREGKTEKEREDASVKKEKLEKEKEATVAEHEKNSATKERVEFGQARSNDRGIMFSKAEKETVWRIDKKLEDLEREVRGLYTHSKGWARNIDIESQIRQLQFDRNVVIIRNFRKHVSEGDVKKWNEIKDKSAIDQIFNGDGSRNAGNKLSDVYRLLELKLFPMVEKKDSRKTVEGSVILKTEDRLEGKEPEKDEKGNIIYPFRYAFTTKDLEPKKEETADAWITRMVKLAKDLDADLISKKPVEKPEDSKKKDKDPFKEKIEKDYKEQKRRRGQGRQIKNTLGKLNDKEQKDIVDMLESDDDSSENIKKVLIEKELSEKGLMDEYKKMLAGKIVKKVDKEGKEKEELKKPSQEDINKFLKKEGIRVGEFTKEHIKEISSKIKYLNQIGLAGLSREQKINLIENNISMHVLGSVSKDILKQLSNDDRGILAERISRNVDPKEISQFVEERLPDGYVVRDENGERDSAVKQNFLAFLMATRRRKEQRAINLQDSDSEEENGNNGAKTEGGGQSADSGSAAGGGNEQSSDQEDSSKD